ncbi:MAG: hypothetical protein QXZ20_04055 [Candidatus Aenigmatarchaeota archaeon]
MKFNRERISADIEKTIKKMVRTIVKRSFGGSIEKFIEKKKISSRFYERSLKSKRGVIYHWDLDGTISAALIIQYLLERYRDFPKILGSSHKNLFNNIRNFVESYKLEELFIVDLAPIENTKIIQLPKLTIITDKEISTIKNYEKEGMEMVGSEDNKSTSELTYYYIKSKGFKGNNVERLVEIASMSHGKRADEEAKTIQYSLELIPWISEAVVFELAENGNILDNRLWRAMDDCFSVSCDAMNLIYKSYKTLYDGDNAIVMQYPISFFSHLILSEIRGKKGKTAIGIKYDENDITTIARCKNKEDAKRLEEYLRMVTEIIEMPHPDYIIANCPKYNNQMLLNFLKEYCML